MIYTKNIYKVALISLAVALSSFSAFAQNKKSTGNSKKTEQTKTALFEKISKTKVLDSIPIYLNQFLKTYPNATKDPRYNSYALYGAIAQRMAEEKRWDLYDLYRGNLIANDATELDFGTAIDIFRSNGDLNVAERLAVRALQQYEKLNTSDLPKDGRPDSVFFKNEQDREKGNAKRTYKNGKPDSALVNNEKIRKYGDMSFLVAEIAYNNKHYALGLPYALKSSYILRDNVKELYLKLFSRTAEPKIALKAIEDYYHLGNVNDDELPKIIEELYREVHQSDEGFTAYYNELKTQSIAASKERLSKEKLSLPAADFSLFDMNGKTVTLSELKGKTVVLDFWATWCYYCKVGFPGMQKVIDAYRTNDKVVFLFINTQESLEESTRKKEIASYLANNKFTFEVLLDTKKNPNYDVVTAYKVDGLPTKFVIGPDGKIAFKEVGFSGSNEKLITDLSVMIELAK